MKYSILGFNQEQIVNYHVMDGDKELSCDLTDLALLNYIIYAQANPKMLHTVNDDGIAFVWLQHQHILEDLPILNITDGTLRNRFVKLRKMNLIDSITIANTSGRGSKTYYAITSFLNDMLYTTTSFKNDTVSTPCHSKMMSNTEVDSNNKVNSINTSKEVLQEFDFGSKKKSSKPNLFTKCVQLIDSYDFSVWDNIRPLLLDYLNFRLQVKEKPLYTNMWKGMLNKLANMCGEDIKKYEQVIQYSLERGYLSFYEPSNNYGGSVTNRPWESGVKSETSVEQQTLVRRRGAKHDRQT